MKKKIFIYMLLTALSAMVLTAAMFILLLDIEIRLTPAVAVCLLVIAALAAVAGGFSTLLTKKLVAPIELMARDLEHMGDSAPYPELSIFTDTVRRQQEKRRENELMRQQFTANVSHELKTPLTSISGYAEMIETGIAKPEDVTAFAGKIRIEAVRMQALIGDIIQLSELDAFDDRESFGQIELLEVTRSAATYLELNAEKAGVSLSVGGEPARVMGNRGLLEEMVYNLCDNAIRYNSSGGVVDVSVTSEGGRVRLIVADTGIGIPEEHRGRVFERFYRVDKSRSRETGGTGLGLAIVKHIAIRHDALIALGSVPGGGTEISVDFPAVE